MDVHIIFFKWMQQKFIFQAKNQTTAICQNEKLFLMLLLLSIGKKNKNTKKNHFCIHICIQNMYGDNC